MSNIGEWLGGPVLSWLPYVTLILLLASQPWRANMPAGTMAHFLGATLSAVIATSLATGTANNAWLWALVSVLYCLWIIRSYVVADNHQYLIAYWCVAVAVAVRAGSDGGAQMLQRNASLLIGLCFAIATLAKFVNRSYRDGSFFVWVLATDSRFMPLARYVGGLTDAVRDEHRAAQSKVRAGVSSEEHALVPRPLRRLALALTWWTVGIEGVSAVLFLVPSVPLFEWLRAPVLVLFALTTFGIVAVPLFGQILLTMALATTADVWMRWILLLAALWMGVLSFIPDMTVVRLGKRTRR